tara:strand:+ start:541 stop:2184 length:1644 start_codon:yes stop_codon:yes gene_type:complete
VHLKKKQFRLFSIEIFSFIFLSSFINAQAQQVSNAKTTSLSVDTTYLESKDELEDYILGTGDAIEIRFNNRPKKSLKIGFDEKIKTNDISYLVPRSNLDNYILDSGDIIELKFIQAPDLSGEFLIDQDGEVYLPRIKSAYVKGLTRLELNILLEKRYEEFLVSPDIEVSISKFKFIPSGLFIINEEGEILLPKIPTDPDEITRKTFVRGLTTNGLKNLLEKRYAKYLINPKIFIEIKQFKPIRVSVKGQVRSPGLVKFPAYSSPSSLSVINPLRRNQLDENGERLFASDESLKIDTFNKEAYNNTSEFSSILNSPKFSSKRNLPTSPFLASDNSERDKEYLTTLSNAIRGAGGLTSFSDISNLQIIRDIPIEKGGGKKRATIDFLSYLNEARDTNNIRLFDGDTIFIPSLQEKNPSILPNSILAGLTPKFIDVEISGQIENPGKVKIPIEGSLSDVMNLRGPSKPLSGKVYLIRYNQDGTLLRRNIKYSANARPGSNKNPYLLAGDLITVKKSYFGKLSGTLKSITEPFLGIYATKQVVEEVGGTSF